MTRGKRGKTSSTPQPATHAELAEQFSAAIAAHRDGGLQDASAGYEAVLAVHPEHADALHLLGVIASQSGRHDQAVVLIDRALAVNADNPDFHSNRGIALQGCGQLAAALASYDRALALRPTAIARRCCVHCIVRLRPWPAINKSSRCGPLNSTRTCNE